MKLFAWQCFYEPRMSVNIPPPDATQQVLKELEALLREQEKLRQEIETAQEQELRSHFDRRAGDRRSGRDRRHHDE